MNANYFRALIVFSLLTSFAANLVDNLFPSLLAGLSDNAFASTHPPLISWVFDHVSISMAMSAIYILFMLASLIGLLMLKPWGRTLALLMTVINICAIPFIGPNYFSGLAYAFFEVSAMSWGAALTLAYFSSISQHFQAKPTSPVNS